MRTKKEVKSRVSFEQRIKPKALTLGVKVMQTIEQMDKHPKKPEVQLAALQTLMDAQKFINEDILDIRR